MPTHLKNTTITLLHPLHPLTYAPADLAKWIHAAGGHATTKLLPETTHIVCSEKAWRTSHPVVSAALQESMEGTRKDLVVVSPSWIEDALHEKRKPKSGPYAWAKLAGAAGPATAATQAQTPATMGSKSDTELLLEGETTTMAPPVIMTTQGLMREVLVESTEKFVSAADKREIERVVREREEVARREEVAAGERRRKEREQAAVLRRGARRGRAELFSDNHHIYTDASGFRYDILLTKVDLRHNRNERYALTLQLHESNSIPHSYATSLHFAGTARVPASHVIAALGSPFPAAFRTFRVMFREKTKGVEWEDRVSAAVERKRKVRSGENEEEDEEFEEKAFVYFPPVHEPRGVLPEAVTGAEEANLFEQEEAPVLDFPEEMVQQTGADAVDAEVQGETVGGAPTADFQDVGEGELGEFGEIEDTAELDRTSQTSGGIAPEGVADLQEGAGEEQQMGKDEVLGSSLQQGMAESKTLGKRKESADAGAEENGMDKDDMGRAKRVC